MKPRVKKFYVVALLVNIVIFVTLAILLINGFVASKGGSTTKKSITQTTISPTPKKLDERTAVLSFPQPNASQEDHKTYAATVAKYAKKTDTISISGCRPEPVATEVTYQQTVTFKNPDTVAHTVATDQNHKVTVPAKGEAKFAIDFGESKGIFAYGCDDSPSGVGVFAIPQDK